MKVYSKYLILFLLVIFVACKVKKPIETPASPSLENLMPKEEDFASEPLYVKFEKEIKLTSFEEYKNTTLASYSEDKRKLIELLVEQIGELNFQRCLTHVFSENVNNVTFSIVYYQFGSDKNAEKAVSILDTLITLSFDQQFKYMESEKPFGENQIIKYTPVLYFQVFIGIYRRDNVVCFLFVPYKNIFSRVLPISSKYFKKDDKYATIVELREYSKVSKPNFEKLELPLENNKVADNPVLRSRAEELSAKWLNFFKDHVENSLIVANKFFKECDRKNLDEAIRYVDLRNSQNIIPNKLPDWYKNIIENRFGSRIEISFDNQTPIQTRQEKISKDGGVRYQYPKIGFVQWEGKIKGSKRTGNAKFEFSLFGEYIKLVDIEILR